MTSIPLTPTPHASCVLLRHSHISEDLFQLDFAWSHQAPKGGQFFMIKPERGSVFLGRPISVFDWKDGGVLSFLIARRGKGTTELRALRAGESAYLTGPLGNTWGDMELTEGPLALVSGGIGIAPLLAFAQELPPEGFDFYAGFKSRSFGMNGLHSRAVVLATEDGSEGRQGRILDFLKPAKYRALYACGPEPMLKAAAALCKTADVPCFISMERRMACGVGACLGCTVRTIHGNRRCCADGPIFRAEEILFDE
ncbi:MAG: dihydroorotate dehydrogenase electron transfer subunit [Treponema sp.]|nr:dihydroorotate dehydrogenase electron transfer subunit [Treponema sp.]